MISSTIFAVVGAVVTVVAGLLWAFIKGSKMNKVQNDLDDATEYNESRKAIDREKLPIDTPVSADDIRRKLRERDPSKR